MEQRPSRMSPGGSQPRSRPPAACRPSEPKGAQLWLFPSAPSLSSALSRRSEETRQMCCTRDRLAVLERGGAGIQVHQLPVGSDGAKKPKCIKLGKKMKIHSVDQGTEHMLILSSDGKPFEYNYNIECERLQCILQEKYIIQITCGDYHSLALSKGGELFAWGQNSHGQLGLGKVLDSAPTPQIVEHLSGVPLAQISAGKAHSMALSMSGNIYSWGRNNFGQLGLGHTDNEDFPSLIEALNSQKVEFLACGGSHTAVLTKDGLLFTFGAGKYGQLGHNSTENELKPCLVTELVGNRVTQIACGRWHTLAYVSDLGKVFAFGSGKEGQLGNGGTHNQLIPLPMKLPSNEEIRFESRNSEKELILIAGGNQSILLWMKKENPYVNLRRKIPTLNEGTVKRWIADVGTKQWQNTKREIREIFSSPACLTGSFVRERRATETMSVHLDLNKARNAFKELTQKDCITNMVITTCLRDNLLKNLPFPSHQEALGVFFLLPECPMMHDCNNWENLVIPFAEAVCKMSDTSSGALEEYWASLQESAFIKLVQMFKRVITAQLCHCTQSAESNCHIRVLLEMFKRLHRVLNYYLTQGPTGFLLGKDQIVNILGFGRHMVSMATATVELCSSSMKAVLGNVKMDGHGCVPVNKTKCQLPENIFQISELTHCLDFYEDARRRSCWKMSLDTPVDLQYPVIFSHFPFIFNILSKIKLLHADSHLKIQERKIRAYKQWTGIVEDGGSSLALLPTFNLTVRRSHLIEDVLNQLNQFENEDLRGELMVSFSGEIEHDFGGVRAEFFHCLFEEMTRPEYGMFMYPEESSYMWFPVRPKFEEKRYFYFGILCGLSLFNYNVADIPFPLALFKKLLDQTPSLEDLKELSPVLGRSLQTLLEDECADFEEEFYTYFNVHWDKTDVELIPDGSYIIVNQTNKTDYVSKYVDYIFNTSIKAVYEEFQRGFYKVCDKEVIEIFHPEELKDVIIGNTDYDWETFEKNAQCGPGYDDSSHPTIVMFWKALRKLTLEEKKKFLVFLTGTDRIQVKGIKNMAITFCCPEDVNEKDPMRAQTCFSILCLPKYSTMERVEEALQVAINNNRGFG